MIIIVVNEKTIHIQGMCTIQILIQSVKWKKECQFIDKVQFSQLLVEALPPLFLGPETL